MNLTTIEKETIIECLENRLYELTKYNEKYPDGGWSLDSANKFEKILKQIKTKLK
jgi:hypothetical protein